MYAIIKGSQILFLSEKKPKSSEIEFDEAIQYSFEGIPEYIDGKIIEKQETPEDFKKRKIGEIIAAENPRDVDTNGFSISKSDIGPIIISKFFNGDSNAEMAYLQKWNFLTSISEKTPEQEAEIEMIKAGYIAKEAFKDFLLTLINK